MNIIETKNLTKSYADFTAVSGINLHIPKGAVYGFLGPNGAGKSTTMKMFLGLTKPTGGSFTIDGKMYSENRVQILKEIGSFIEAPAFYGNLSGEENLEIIRKILGLPKSSSLPEGNFFLFVIPRPAGFFYFTFSIFLSSDGERGGLW